MILVYNKNKEPKNANNTKNDDKWCVLGWMKSNTI